MSIVEKIGLLPILEQLGLTEEQFRGILKGEIDRLAKQEQVLNEQIATHATKINELTELRSKANQLNEQEKLEIEAQKKKIIELRGIVDQERKNANREKQDVLILRQQLNDDKAQFQKDREIISQNGDKLAAELKRQKEIREELEDKTVALVLQKDELYITQSRVNSESKKLLEEKQEFDRQTAILAGERAKLNDLRKSVEDESKETNRMKDSFIESHNERLEKFNDDQKTFEAEKAAALENIRKRELDLVRREKEIKSAETDIKARLETLEIKEAKLQEIPAPIVEKPKEKKSKKG